MAEAIIQTQGLTKRFGDFTAVDKLSIDVHPGTIFAFLGANGSGKSTTIRMLIGLLRPTTGTIEVDGVDVICRPRKVRDHIGYMGQKVSLYQGLSLRENVEFYAGLYGLSAAQLEERRLRRRVGVLGIERERDGAVGAGGERLADALLRVRVAAAHREVAAVPGPERLLERARLRLGPLDDGRPPADERVLPGRGRRARLRDDLRDERAQRAERRRDEERVREELVEVRLDLLERPRAAEIHHEDRGVRHLEPLTVALSPAGAGERGAGQTVRENCARDAPFLR